MRISDWSSDVCSSDLRRPGAVGRGDMRFDQVAQYRFPMRRGEPLPDDAVGIGLAGEAVVRIVDERHPAGHPGAEIGPDHAEHHRARSEERRVGKEWVSKGSYRWSQ